MAVVQSPPAAHRYFPGADVARFAAAMLVALFHLGFWTWAIAPRPGPGSPPFPPFAGLWFGWVGVEIFFVISGLVIANSANGQPPLRFLASRAMRLYPGAWICASIAMIALLWDGQHPGLKTYLVTMTLAPVGQKLDWVYWTLNLEIVFYAIIFLLLAARRFASLASLAWALTLPGIVLTAIRSDWNFAADPAAIAMSFRLDWHSLTLLRYASFFATGLWLWLWGARPSPGAAAGLLLAAAGGAGAIWDRAAAIAKMADVTHHVSQATPVLAWLATVAALLVVTQYNPGLGKPGRTRFFLRRLGVMTYPLYLLHNNIGQIALQLLVRAGLPRWPALLLTLGGLLGLSWAVCALGEPPIRGALRLLFARFESFARRHPAGLGFLIAPGGEIQLPAAADAP